MTEPAPKRRKHSHDSADDDVSALGAAENATHDKSERNHENTNGTAVVHAPTDPIPDAVQHDVPPQPLSKNQLKKLRKREEWEAGRDYRKAKRKEKIQERKARKKEQKQQAAQERRANGGPAAEPDVKIYQKSVRLPVTLVIDCGFDDKMMEKERISLGSQLTRSYSDNSKAPFQVHLYISSWNGLLKERFDTVLHQHYKNWRGIEFTSEDFVAAANAADEAMKGANGGKLAGIFTKHKDQPTVQVPQPEAPADGNATDVSGSIPSSSRPIDELKSQGEVVYLTSDSPHTLTELKPYSTYIIGGLVDKNRHKGICYKVACERGIQTAKLPIGQYMEMQSRFVLATNHVNEIMLRYLECGDWGEAFMKVMPKRKGAKLRDEKKGESASPDHAALQDHDNTSEDELNSDDENEVPQHHSALTSST